jgi:hypothetical protein
VILTAGVKSLAVAFPGVARVLGDEGFEMAAAACVGLDGRQIKKAIVAACGLDKLTAMEPDRLSAKDLLRAIELAQAQANQLKEKRR